MTLSARSIFTVAPCFLMWLSACGGATTSADGSGGGPPDDDTNPPFTQASPGPGLYHELQFVTLSSNEPATIYYTTDGFPPTVGGTTTIFGPSPIPGIFIDHPLTLRYFGIDTIGNEESIKSAAYDFDLNPPNVSIQDPLIGTYGFLETIEMGFLSDENGSYVVELGGTGLPGSGELITTGQVAANTIVTAKIPGWRLEIGQLDPGNPVFLYVADIAQGITSVPFHLKTKTSSAIAVNGTMGDIELTPDGRFGYLLNTDLGELWKFDTDPSSPDFHTILSQTIVGASATHMDITGDSTRVYLTLGAGFAEVNVATDAVNMIPMPGGRTPTGIAIHNNLQFALVVSDDGGFWQLDVDPLSPGFRTAVALVSDEPLMSNGEFFFGPHQNQALLVWSGPTGYGVKHFITDASDSNFLGTPTDIICDMASTLISDAAIRSDGQRGWAGDVAGRVTHLALDFVPPIAGNSSPNLTARGITVAPDDSVLLLTGGPLLGIRIVDPVTLVERKFVPANASGTGGTSRQLRFSPDGTRAYMVRGNGTATAEIWVLQI